MKFPVFGTSDDAPSASATNYVPINNYIGDNWNATENLVQTPISEDITITDLQVTVDIAPGAGTSRAFTVRKNGADTGVTCTISDTNTTASFSGSVAFSAGDLLSLKSVPTNTPGAPGNIYWHMFWNTTGTKCLLLGRSGGTASTSVTNYASPCASNVGATDGNNDIVVPTSGSMTKLTVATPAGSPGSGKSYAISGRLNDATDFLTATISDTNTSASATGTQVLAPGDALQMKVVPSGTPTARAPAWCLTFVPDVASESFWGHGASTNASASATNFNSMTGNSAWTATENTRYLRLPAVALKKLYVKLSAASGAAKSRTCTLRQNDADTALTVLLSNVTTNNDTTHSVTLTANDRVDMESLVASNPAASSIRFGFVIDTPQPVVASSPNLMLMGV